MTDLKHLLRRKKRTGDWNVGDGEYKATLRVGQLTGVGFCYARALDTAAKEYDVSADDLERH